MPKAIAVTIHNKWLDNITIAITKHKSIRQAFRYAKNNGLLHYTIETETRIVYSKS